MYTMFAKVLLWDSGHEWVNALEKNNPNKLRGSIFNFRGVWSAFSLCPNFEEVDGAYWFRVVRPCVRARPCASVRQEPRMLGF